jgi:hypothetical protein
MLLSRLQVQNRQYIRAPQPPLHSRLGMARKYPFHVNVKAALTAAGAWLAPSVPVLGVRFFCQNSGGCGSLYITKLMRANGYADCHHEKSPDLDDLGIEMFEGTASIRRVKFWLRVSRRDVWFEANNRLFSMGRQLHEVFPEARFIHLHRDPRKSIPSGLSKQRWKPERIRYQSKALNGASNLSELERACTYWANYNARICRDLLEAPTFMLPFDDLVAGRLDALEKFMSVALPIREIPPANADKPIRGSGIHPPFDAWSASDQDTLMRICGPVMERLGYH